MGDKKNEKFMNFGPEWLQNLSNDSPSASGTQRSNSSASSISIPSATPGLRPANALQLAQHRYGREEMLALYSTNLGPPNGLSQHSELYVSNTQLPIALQTDTSAEMGNRRGWVTNMNRGFNSSSGSGSTMGIRLMNRNIQGDRTRPRDSRPFIQQDFFPNRRTFYHSNTNRVGARPPHDLAPNRGMDRNNRDIVEGETRRDFGSNSRWGADANWRRQSNKANEDEDGWRSGNDHNRPRSVYPGMDSEYKRLSWRDDDGGRDSRENRFDRDRDRDFNDRGPDKRDKPTAWTTHKIWTSDSSTDDLLPEWANADNLGHSGSFDSTGAFLGGSSNDEKEDDEKENSKSLNENVKNIHPNNEINKDIEKSDSLNNSPPNESNAEYKTEKTIPMPRESPDSLQNIVKPTEQTNAIIIGPDQDRKDRMPLLEKKMDNTDNSDLLLSQIEKMLGAADDDNILKNTLSSASMPTFGSFTESTALPSSTLTFMKCEENRNDLTFIQPSHSIGVLDDLSRKNGNPNQFTQNSFGCSSIETVTSNENVPPIATNFKSHDFLMRELVQQLMSDDDDNVKNSSPSPLGQPPLGLPKNLPPNVNLPPSRLLGKTNKSPPTCEDWFYRDPQGEVQGPFTSLEMAEWFDTGYFTNNLLVCRGNKFNFIRLGHLMECCKGVIPFVLPIAFIDNIIANISNQTMQGPSLLPLDLSQPPSQLIHPYTVEMLQKDMLLKQQQQQQQKPPLMGLVNMVNPGSIPTVAFQPSNDMLNHSPLVNDYLVENSPWVPPPVFPWRDSSMQPIRNQLPSNMTPLLMPVHQPINQSAVNIPIPVPPQSTSQGHIPPHIPMPQSIWELQNSASSSNLVDNAMRVENQQMQAPPLAHSLSMPALLHPQGPPQHIFHPLHQTQPQVQQASFIAPPQQQQQPQPQPQLGLIQQPAPGALIQSEFQPSVNPILNDNAIVTAIISKPFDKESKPVVSSAPESQTLKDKTDKKKKVTPEMKKKSEGNGATKKKEDKKVESPKLKRKGKNNKEPEKPAVSMPEKDQVKAFKTAPPPTKMVTPALQGIQTSVLPLPIEDQAASKEPSRIAKASVAPWAATKSVLTEPNNAMSLTDIQKLEREMKVEENRVLINFLGAYKADKETKLKWAENRMKPVKIMTLAEIQAEEQARLSKVSVNKNASDKELMTAISTNPSGTSWAAAAFSASAAANSAMNMVSSANWWGSTGETKKTPSAAGFWDTPFSKNNTNNINNNNGGDKDKPRANNPQTKPQPAKPAKVELTKVYQKPTQQKKEYPEPMPTTASKTAKTDALEEFLMWSKMTAYSINSEIDSSAFVSFLLNLEAPYEVKEYAKFYLGENKESNEFAKQFIEKRSKILKRNTVPSDDLSAPAAAVNPALLPNEFSESKNKNKKNKKNKMVRLDARNLGFNTTAATDRFNVGDIDMA